MPPHTFGQILDQRLSTGMHRRVFIQASVATFLGGTALLGGCLRRSDDHTDNSFLSFEAVPASERDKVIVPTGYHAEVLVSWGDSLNENVASVAPSGYPDAASQLLQFGDNNDGMSLFPIDHDTAVLAINNEYTNYPFLFSHQGKSLSAKDVATAQAAVGVSILEIKKTGAGWAPVKSSPYNRRIHANTVMDISGPAAGHALLQTDADFSGTKVLGTFANCANGQTPWGTYLTCEENFDKFFGSVDTIDIPPRFARYGFSVGAGLTEWCKHDSRFDIHQNPNEPNRFGWVVEIDPLDPKSTPVKRTALGRFSHENAAFALSKDNKAVVYMGDDAKGEYIYKFVSTRSFQADNPAHNRSLLDEGVLYVAKFEWEENALAGNGHWIPLTLNTPGLDDHHFKDMGELLIYVREAADRVGATPMDRPEWVAVNPNKVEAYCTLTNNEERGSEDQPVGGPNPRANNRYGQIVRWQPAQQDHGSHAFTWDLFVLAGHPIQGATPLEQGSANVTKDNMFNSPDGLGFDPAGGLWILTDGDDSNSGDFKGMGNNQLLAADPISGEIKRFLVGPKGCEVTGLCFSPDQQTLFLGIQHPTGAFPNGRGTIPRSSVLSVRRMDGGKVGA